MPPRVAEIQNDVSAPNKYFLGYDIVMAAADCIAKVGTDYTALHDALENLSYEGRHRQDHHRPHHPYAYRYEYVYVHLRQPDSRYAGAVCRLTNVCAHFIRNI